MKNIRLMTPKRLITLIVLLFCILQSSAQTSLTFTPTEWDFGTIRESDGRVSHIFTGTNTSDKPVVILNVFSSCGCTVPEYSKKPILPGENTEVKVTYNPANRPGAFNRELGLYDNNQRRIGKLTIRGSVIAREKTVAELYPVDAGAGVRLSETLSAFSYLYHDRPAFSVIGIVNTSDKPVRVELHPEAQDHFLTLDYPRTLPAGARGEIRIEFDIPASSARYGVIKEILPLWIDGREARVKLMAHGIAVDNPELSNEICCPKAEIDKYMLKFGTLKRGAGVQKLPVTISNPGDGTLIVRDVEIDKGFGCTLHTGKRIGPGKSVTAYVTVDPANQEYGPLTGYLTVITNDPEKPLRKVRLTAIIEA